MTRAELDKQPRDVAAMFDAVAGRYDLMNDLLSAGQVRLWRRAVTRIVAAGPGDTVLDLAAGTGTSARSFAAGGAGVIACDFSLGMLRAGKDRGPELPRAGKSVDRGAGLRSRGKTSAGSVTFVAGDALNLPFEDQSFDVTTISFGLRNVADTKRALEEMRRVTRPSGRLVICEFSRITSRPLDHVYRRYLLAGLPAIANRAARNPEAYVYLAESILDWPAQPELARTIEQAGWQSVRWRDLTLGIVAVHVARR